MKKTKILIITILLLLGFVSLDYLLGRSPYFKMAVEDSDFYYRDIVGRIYVKRGTSPWFGSGIKWFERVKGAYIFSFELVPYQGTSCVDSYAKDKSHVYYDGKRQDGQIDVSTFEMSDALFAKDKNHIYSFCSLEIVEGFDPEGFVKVGSVYSKDEDQVYYFNRALEGADASSFEHVERGFYKDKNHIYWQDKVLAEIDVNTFAHYGWGYLSDSMSVYWLDEKKKEITSCLEGVTPEVFENLSNYYAKANGYIFYQGEVVENADAATFEIVHEKDRDAKDAQRFYFQGQEEGRN